MTDEPSFRHFMVRGRVQGVGFRHFVWRKATELELQGWVQNLEDGSVEVAAWGFKSQIDILNTELERGPKWSMVDSVAVDQLGNSEAPAGQFSIRT